MAAKTHSIKTDARLIVADSERNADQRYATGLSVPDPFIFFQVGQRKSVVMTDLEIDRARRHAAVDRVLAYTDYRKKIEARTGKPPQFVDVLEAVLRDHGIRSMLVPADFPLHLADTLRRRKFRVIAQAGAFFPQRETKTPEEVRRIREALRITAAGLQAGVDALRKSRIGKDGFLYDGALKLTSERLRAKISTAILWAGGDPGQPIVAGGAQACDPHEVGHGPLRAHQSIILDIFPRSQKTGYFGDMTRTFVRGRASEALKKLYRTVHTAQKTAMRAVRAGVDGETVHKAVQKVFADAGYESGKIRGRMQGFFHGTGHGLGLEVHEAPRVSAVSNLLKAGHVVTVEPGLYYQAIGGVRIEDVALVTKRGAKMLSLFPYFLEI
jgi:Xaa-Pro aminopeptidase